MLQRGVAVRIAVVVVTLAVSLRTNAAAQDAGACRAGAAPLDVTHETRVGAITGSREYSHVRIAGITTTRDGSMWVLDSGTREVRVYDPNGAHRFTVGGEGEGPGEFRRPLEIVGHDSVVAVVDAALGRETWLGLEGELLDAKRWEPVAGLNVKARYPIDERSTLIVTTARLAYGSGHHQPSQLVVLIGADSGGRVESVDTLAAFHSGAVVYHPEGRTLPWGAMAAEFGPAGAVAVGDRGLIALADGYRGMVEILRVEDGTLRVDREIDLGRVGQVIDTEDLDALGRRFRDERESGIGGKVVFEPPERWSIATDAIVSTANDRVWIQAGRTIACRSVWHVIDLNRGGVRSVIVPEGFLLRHVTSERLYGSRVIELDVPVVDVYRYRISR